MDFYKRFRDAAICVALLALPFFVLKSSLKDPSRTNAVDRAILQVSAPLQYLGMLLARTFSDLAEEYVYLVDVRRENDRLRDENARLRAEIDRLHANADDAPTLRRLLDIRADLPGETLSALVIGKEWLPQNFRVIRIRLDRGERENVRPGMPVIAANGLVGQIRRTWGRYSDVLLTVDRTSAIDVVIRPPNDATGGAGSRAERRGARGMLRGTGQSDRYLCRIQYLLREDEVHVGDLVYTSGYGRRFPPDLSVGRVTRVTRESHGLYQEAEVEPSVDFASLETVLVMTAGSREADFPAEAPRPRREH